MNIAVTGATGFIGSNLVQYLLDKTEHNVVALTRNPGVSQHPRLKIVTCDLYSKIEIDQALAGCDQAAYLVHSMSKPTSRLVQGDFRDFDFLLADNFARSARLNNLKQIVYVSGLLPEEHSGLSEHLASRYEVEKVLHDQAVPVTALRCGLVIGQNGSSFRIIERLVKRLPVMLLPTWMRTRTQSVYVGDLVQVVIKCFEAPSSDNRSYDVASPELLTYQQILLKTIAAVGRRRKLIEVPMVPLWLSKFWVSTVSGVSRQLVFPLINSLMHELVTKPGRLLPRELSVSFTPIETAIQLSLNLHSTWRLPVTWGTRQTYINEVQSIQRLPLPAEWDMTQMAEEYKNWIPRLFRSLIRADAEGDELVFYSISRRIPLLKLKLRPETGFNGRKMFSIVGGWLAKDRQNGVLEFREGLRRKFAIAAIFRYQPKLIWYVYVFTQAQVHAWVMARFAAHLRRQPPSQPKNQ